jgi:hypothetical protein
MEKFFNNAGTQYRALYVNIEAAQAYREQVDKGIGTVGGALAASASLHLKESRW